MTDTKQPGAGREYWDRLCRLPKHSFIIANGGVKRVADSAGNWIEYSEAQAIVDDAQARITVLEMTEGEFSNWLNKTEWVQKTGKPSELGMHRADVLRERIAELEAENRALKELCEATNAGNIKDATRYRWLRDTQYAKCRKDEYQDMDSGVISRLWVGTGGGAFAPRGIELDAAIDAAIAQEGGK